VTSLTPDKTVEESPNCFAIMDALMDAQENDAYLSTLNELKPTASFEFAEPKEIKVRAGNQRGGWIRAYLGGPVLLFIHFLFIYTYMWLKFALSCNYRVKSQFIGALNTHLPLGDLPTEVPIM